MTTENLVSTANDGLDAAFALSSFGDEPLPLVIEPRDRRTDVPSLLEAIGTHRDALAARMRKSGGLLFRGFDVTRAGDFASIVEALGTGTSLDYIGGDSPRIKVERGVYTSTEAPPSFKIPLHGELSFVRDHPKHIFFFCEIAPAKGGETIIADARRVYGALDAGVRARFIDKGLRYVSRYYGKSPFMQAVNPSHKSWHQVFETDDRHNVEELCRAHDFELEWSDDNWIKVSQTRPAATQHPVTGEWVWFSQAHLYDFNRRLLGSLRWLGAKMLYAREKTRLHEVSHADGSPVKTADLEHILDTLDAQTIAFSWRAGDVLALDNLLSMHGRATFEGSRRVLAALTG